MVRHCVNCVAPLTTHNPSEFCSRHCSDSYWAMQDIQTEPKEKAIEMAKKTEVLVTVVDDLTGEEFIEGQGETFVFTFDGEKYELDLSDKNAKSFRTAVKKYVDAARVTTGRRPGTPSEAAEVRSWAAENGVQVSAKGRIPEAILTQYRASQSSE